MLFKWLLLRRWSQNRCRQYWDSLDRFLSHKNLACSCNAPSSKSIFIYSWVWLQSCNSSDMIGSSFYSCGNFTGAGARFAYTCFKSRVQVITLAHFFNYTSLVSVLWYKKAALVLVDFQSIRHLSIYQN